MSMLDQAPASAAAGRGELLSNAWRALLGWPASFSRAWRGRKLVQDMRDFDDAQLADIGLKRSDVESALLLPFTADPSMHLVMLRQNPLRGSKRF